MLEKKNWPHAYFITFTYDDEHIHISPIIDKKTGEIIPQSTLNKKDFQIFMKSYRRKVITARDGAIPHDYGKVAYYMCGEYGDTTHRAHYHRIIFQEKPITDLKYLKLTRDHLPLYTSEEVDKIWGNGITFIGEVTMESRGYVARYCIKKQTGENAIIYDELGITPEYVRMSNGLGMDYFKENWGKIYKNDEIIYTGMDGKRKRTKPPKAYDEAFWEIDPTKHQITKDARRETAINNRESKQAQTTRTDWAEIELRSKQQRQKLLKREDI